MLKFYETETLSCIQCQISLMIKAKPFLMYSNGRFGRVFGHPMERNPFYTALPEIMTKSSGYIMNSFPCDYQTLPCISLYGTIPTNILCTADCFQEPKAISLNRLISLRYLVELYSCASKSSSE